MTGLDSIGRTAVRTCRVCGHLVKMLERRIYLRDANSGELIRLGTYWEPCEHIVQHCGALCEYGAKEEAPDLHTLQGCASCERVRVESRWLTRWFHREARG